MALSYLQRASMKSASCQSLPERMQRFGELPDWVETRLRDASPEQLEIWGERLLEASRLEEIFEAGGGH